TRSPSGATAELVAERSRQRPRATTTPAAAELVAERSRQRPRATTTPAAAELVAERSRQRPRATSSRRGGERSGQVEAQVEGRGRFGDPTDRDHVHPGRGVLADRV